MVCIILCVRVSDPRIDAFLGRLRRALAAATVVMTRKAAREAAEELDIGQLQVMDVLSELEAGDFDHAAPSTAVAGDLIWVFTPEWGDHVLWIRLAEREHMIVVSFHEA